MELGATFVTLRLGGELQGCIGSIAAVRPLIEDLRHNTLAAASQDPRFPPLDPAELDEVELEVTLLSPPRAMDFTDEADALAQLRPGVDGVVLRWGSRRSTFLPQVWEMLPSPEVFLAQLKKKAGLPEDFWHPDLGLERYTAEKWSESDLGEKPSARE
jgi:hypothetical protein